MSRVRFDHVSKEFTLHLQRSRSFQELFLGLRHLNRRRTREKYWALSDVSFEIESGEMVGIIGPNGAGKSTILKLISRIIEPTSGQIEINGEVGALLELGAGFHPDLSGRENVYLNGSILGFSKAEMDCVFDEILDFSEMERFIDVPVKHYSSGMYMRLGFSIAIHLHPAILLVDEVLAVGDQTFQFRCLDRINKMKRDGVAIVLVSHDMESVREMCDRAIWLDEGQIRAQGAVEQVLDGYMTQVFVDAEQTLLAEEATHQQAQALACHAGGRESRQAGTGDAQPQRWGSREGEIVRVQILDDLGQERRVFKTGDTLIVRMHYLAKRRIDHPQFGLALYHASGFHINGPNTVFAGLDIEAIEGEGTIEHVIESLPLLEGTYLLSVSLYDESGDQAYDHHHQAYTFRVRPNEAVKERYGCVLIPSVWRMGPVDRESDE